MYKLVGISIEDEILHEFPKLSLISNYHIQEYNADHFEISSCVKSNHTYLVILPFKDKQYIVGSYTRRAKANNLINKAELHNAFILDIECRSLCENDIKSLYANDLDSLM
jgi:hypothetical protein